jgi:pimeloyl-ACP methyl ester carboxylesterase
VIRVEQQRVYVGGVPIAYRAAGQGAPVVLVHGLSGSARWWARNIEPLARRFRVYVVDLVGFGNSRGPRRFVLSEASDYLVRWLDVLGVERAHVVGHSMGGFIAADLAADHPTRLDRLVLVDAAALPFRRGPLGHVLDLLRTVRGLSLGFLPLLVADAARTGPLTLWRAAKDLLTADLRAKLSRVQAPTLVVWGDRDVLVPLEDGRQLARLLPAGRLAVIPRAGHNPMWDRPAIFNDLVIEFLTAP